MSNHGNLSFRIPAIPSVLFRIASAHRPPAFRPSSKKFGDPENMYVRTMGYDENNPLIALPDAIGGGAGNCSYYCDAWFCSAEEGKRYIVTFGGAWDNMGSGSLRHTVLRHSGPQAKPLPFCGCIRAAPGSRPIACFPLPGPCPSSFSARRRREDCRNLRWNSLRFVPLGAVNWKNMEFIGRSAVL